MQHPVTERFAPSPTGLLHLGHAFSALTAYRAAREAGGRFLLRLEDLDRGRVRPDYEDAILRDLAWLGIEWAEPPLRQSDRAAAHDAAIRELDALGLVFRCACTRRDIAEALSAPQEGSRQTPFGPDGPVYPGTCRRSPPQEHRETALRLDMGACISALGGASAVGRLGFTEIGRGPDGEQGEIRLDAALLRQGTGDIVLRRRDGAVAYHLAVVVDDAFQQVTHVTRGTDLFAATAVHRLLQALLGLPTPVYRHHRLIRDATGRRLAKRDDATSLEQLREKGWTSGDVCAAVGLA